MANTRVNYFLTGLQEENPNLREDRFNFLNDKIHIDLK